MPRRFDFVSPGIQLTEIDQSELPVTTTNEPGPLIVGRALAGPAMKPIRVNTLEDFNEVFGIGIAGKGGSDNDIWREGNTLGPTYGIYAAQAHLASNTTPVTFVRLLGEHNSEANENSEYAGWAIDNNAAPNTNPTQNAAAYGLFVFPEASANVATGSLAAVFYVTGAALALSGNKAGTSDVTASAGTLIDSIGGSVAKFKMCLFNTANPAASDKAAEEFTFNFTPGTSNYIRDQFNTNPQLIKANKNFGLTNKSYFLGETYEESVRSVAGTDTTAGKQTAILLALNSGSLDYGHQKKQATAAKTGWFINRKTAQNTTPEKLFRLVAIHEGEWIQNNYKINIKDLVLGNELVPNSRFTIEICDKNNNVVEQFSNLTLDPGSENYISKVIGDQYLAWDATNLKYNVRGEYLNNSNYVYVEVATKVAKQELKDRHALPVGCHGPLRPKGFSLLHGSVGVNQLGDAVNTGTFSNATLTLSSSTTITTGTTITITDHENRAYKIDLDSSINLADSSGSFDANNLAKVGIGDQANTNSGSIASQIQTILQAAPTNGVGFRMSKIEDTGLDGLGVVLGVSGTVAGSHTFTIGEAGDTAEFVAVSSVTDGTDTDDFAHAFVEGNATIPLAGGNSGLFAHLPANFSGSVIFPSLRLTEQNSNSNGKNYPPTSLFGVRHHRGASTRRDDSYIDLVRSLPSDASYTLKHHYGENDSIPDSLEYSYIFSLDDIFQDTSNTSTYYYKSGSYDAESVGDQSYSQKNGLSGTNGLFSKKIRQFQVPLFGGFDGLDVTEVEPFSNTNLTDKTRINSYAYNSIFKALETIADPEVITYDLISLPGVTNTDVTDEVLSLVSDRQDALAIIDIPNGYQPGYENSGTEVAGTIDGTINNLEGRVINNSYAATYYPWVRMRDRVGGQNDVLYVPPSVAAIGALGKSQGLSELWFAPAGFNRGGINELGGPKGPIITGTWEHLTKDDRDKLYNANINPIARFPSLDQIVIFGQKTLQQTPSALDRINVRRLMIHLKYRIGLIANTILFDQNVQLTWNRFKYQASGVLSDIQSRLGIVEYKLELDEKTTTADLVDRNILYAKIFIKPARSIEFIAVDFVITRSGVEF
jgi:hypothetical protein